MESSTDLILPPFPPLKWADGSWEGEAVLSAWSGFQSRGGPYDSQDSAEPSNGLCRITVEIPYDAAGQPTPPTSEQAEAWKYLQENQNAIRDAILEATFASYPGWRADFDEDGMDEWMPVLHNPQELKKLMGLAFVHISKTTLDGVAYLGFEMGCTWEVEHGLGALVHRTRVVEIGGADTAFLGWNAQQDADAQQ